MILTEYVFDSLVYSSGILLGFLTTFVVGMIYVTFHKNVDKRLKELSGRRPVFPLGSLMDWDDLLKANSYILEDSKKTDLPVAQWTFLSESFAVVKAEHVAKVLRSSSSRSMTPRILQNLGLFHITRFMGAKSVGVAEGAHWKQLRRQIGASLRPGYIRQIQGQMVGYTQEVVKWIKNTKVDPATGVAALDVSKFLHALTLDIVCMTVFQERLGALDAIFSGTADEVVEAFKYASNEMARRASSQNPLDWMYFFPRKEQWRLNRANKIIRDKVAVIVKRRMKKGIDAEKDNDLLRHLLVGDVTSDSDEVTDQVITMMWAGHDTTSNGVSFCLFLLASYPEYQRRLRSEILAAKAEKNTKHLNAPELSTLPFLNAFINEVLRVHPPALWTNRGMVEDVTITEGKKSVTMKKGTSVFIPIVAIHHSEDNWENATRFDPSRWLPGAPKPKPFAWSPFGGGNRVCPGQGLAPVELRTIVAELVCAFDFSRMKGHSPTIESCGMFQECTNNLLCLKPL